MARVSIYVSDELKTRMDEARDALNWSDIARPAFEAALAAYNHRNGQNMQTAIERLRASRAQHSYEQENDGKQVGRDWASLHATFDELNRLFRINLKVYEHDPDAVWNPIKRAIDPEDNLSLEDALQHLFDGTDPPEAVWLLAWAEGAQEFFDEVRDKL